MSRPQESSASEVMPIGRLASVTGVSVRALRYYEERGLITSVRQANNYRAFAPETVARVRHIQYLIAAGLCSSKIADLLDHTDGDDTELKFDADVLDALAEARRRLTAQRDDIDAAIERLDRLTEATARDESLPVAGLRTRTPARGALRTAAILPRASEARP